MKKPNEIIVLGLETSCDETAAAVVVRGPDGQGHVLANIVRTQWEQHRPFGGVVPEIAARAHVECLDDIIREAMAEARLGWREIDGIAAAAGPGLIGGLIVGLTTAKMLALATAKPLIAVNHLEAHALTVGLTDGLAPPYVLLLVSGGHTLLLLVRGVGDYERLGTTIDDALGEAFDKTAKLLGLGLPGGPAVERLAATGRADRIPLPVPMSGRAEPNFSFAGLKTAVRQAATRLAPLSEADVADICAAFQKAAAASVEDRVARALALVADRPELAGHRHLVVAGGVAANGVLRTALGRVATRAGYTLHAPPIALCTDNGAMIAWAGAERLARGLTDRLDAAPRARWPLDERAEPVLGSGRLGAKA